MRIVGGALRGRKLASPAAASRGAAAEAALRPTSDRAREAVFNLLEHGPYPPIAGGRALDLFAGVGALGLEALSRGVDFALFVDDHPAARALIRENVESLDLTGRTKIYRRDATRLGPHRGAPFTHLFLDPPYGRDLGLAALQSAHDGGWVADDAVAVLETGADEDEITADAFAAAGFDVSDQRRYGAALLTLLTRAG